VAEQIGVRPLYEELYRWSGGPIALDHCWHEFIGFREIDEPENKQDAITSDEFVGRFVTVKEWDETLSPHFAMDAG
jgi:hypothetical protein